jgi:hypothetical protein
VPVQTTRDTTMRTRHKIQSISRLVIFGHTANMLCVLGTYLRLLFSAMSKDWYYAFQHIKRINWAQYDGRMS